MIDGARLGALIKARKKSQSWLAKRVGLDPSTINGLVHGGQGSSTKLHLIAIELRTSVDYLEGRTDDPDVEEPAGRPLDESQRELLDCFDVLSPADRSALLRVACSMAGRFAKPVTFHSGRQEFRAEADEPPRRIAVA